MTSMDADTGQASPAQHPDSSSHPASGHTSSQQQQQEQLPTAGFTMSSTEPPVAAADTSVPTGLLPEGRRGHLDSGYHTGPSTSSTPQFFIGDNAANTQFPFDFEQQGSCWEDVVADSSSDEDEEEEEGLSQPGQREESPVFTNTPYNSSPINIPGHADISQAHSLFTPPRAYMRKPRHLSTGTLNLNAAVSTHPEMELGLEAGQRHASSQMPAASHPAQVMGNVLRQQERAMCRQPPRRPQRRRRARTQSETDSHHGVVEVPMTRDRSLSAPSILTPAQRHCAQELRRISDEFDRSYHGLDSVYQANPRDARVRPASFPSAHHSPAWWQRVVQFIFPQEMQRNRHSFRRQPPSPITESEPHLEDEAPTEDAQH